MKKSRVLNLNGIKLFETFSKNRILIILFSVFISGIFIGVFSGGKENLLNKYTEKFLFQYIECRSAKSFTAVFSASLTDSLIYLLLIFLSGTSLMGIVSAPLLIFTKGILYGNLAAMLYSGYGLKGIAFNAVFIIPSALLVSTVLIFAGKYSIDLSYIIAKLTLPRTAPLNLFEDFKIYCRKYCFLIPAMIFAALLDFILSKSFFGYFNL